MWNGEEMLTSSAVVGALRARETALWPTVGGTVNVEEGVLLLKTEPGFNVLCKIHDLIGVVAVVGPVGGAIVVVALCENEDVVATTERILEDGSGSEVHIGVATRSLVGGRAIKVPDTEGANVGDLLRDSLGGKRVRDFNLGATADGRCKVLCKEGGVMHSR